MKIPTFQDVKEEMYSGQSRPITTDDHLKYFYGAFVKLLSEKVKAGEDGVGLEVKQ